MACKCRHEAVDHAYDDKTAIDPRFPCKKCECLDYDMAPKEAGF